MATRQPPVSSNKPDANVNMSATPFAPPVSDITDAVARGFASVIDDVRAMHQEVLDVSRTMQKSAEIAADRMEVAAGIPDGQGGLSSPSGMSQSAAGAAQRQSRAVAAAASETPRRSMGGLSGTVVSAPPPGDPMAFSEGYAGARGSVRQSIAQGIVSRAQNWAGPQPIQDPRDPNVYYEFDPEVSWDVSSQRWKRGNRFISQAEMDSTRIIKTPGFSQDSSGRWRNLATGAFATEAEVQASAVGFDRLAQIAARQRLAGAASNVAEAYASGQPVGRSLLAALPAERAAQIGKAAGVVGIGYTALRTAASQSQDLYRQGQEIAQYTGQSAFEGFKTSIGDRIDRYFQDFNFFGPGGRDLGILQGRATRLGLTGSAKRNFEETGLDIMGDTKMGAEETARILSTVILAGDSLSDLAENLQQVTDAAARAGVATDGARAAFESTYRSLQGTVFGTSASTQDTAAATTVAQLELGQNAISATANLSLGTLAVVGSTMGMTPTELATLAREDPSDVIAGFEGSTTMRLDNYIGQSGISFGQFARNWLRDWYRSSRGDTPREAAPTTSQEESTSSRSRVGGPSRRSGSSGNIETQVDQNTSESNLFAGIFTNSASGQGNKQRLITDAYAAGFSATIVGRILSTVYSGFAVEENPEIFVFAVSLYTNEVAGELGGYGLTASAQGEMETATRVRANDPSASSNLGIEATRTSDPFGSSTGYSRRYEYSMTDRPLDLTFEEMISGITGGPVESLVWDYLSGSEAYTTPGEKFIDIRQIDESGRKPLVERFLSEAINNRFGDIEEVMVEVGGRRYNLSEAMKSRDVQDAIQAGTAKIITGENPQDPVSGMSVSQVYQLPPDWAGGTSTSPKGSGGGSPGNFITRVIEGASSARSEIVQVIVDTTDSARALVDVQTGTGTQTSTTQRDWDGNAANTSGANIRPSTSSGG